MNRSQILQKAGRIFYMGITDDMPFGDVQKTFMFNLFLLIGLPFITAGIPINFANRHYHLALMNCFLFTLYAIGLRVNITQKHLWYRQLVVVLAASMYVLGPLLYRNGTEYNLLISLMSAVILFESNILFILFSLVVIAFVTYIRVRDTNLLGLRSYAEASPYINIFYSQFLFVLSLYFFKYIYFKYQKQLSFAYENLKKSKEVKDKILQVVAHDLRSPIGGIASLSKILLDKNENLDANQQHYLQMIHKTANQSLGLISELLQNHTNDPLHTVFAAADITALINNSVQLLQYKADEKDQKIFVRLPRDPLLAEVDAEKITRLLQNLLSNAIKFTNPGGHIEIEATEENKMVSVTVKDDGIGIPPAMQASLFNMFSKAQRKGTAGEKSFGIGLSVCKQIIEEHGGTLHVYSEEGKGTSFTFKLRAFAG